MTMDYLELTAAHQVALLKRRLAEVEADHFLQQLNLRIADRLSEVMGGAVSEETVRLKQSAAQAIVTLVHVHRLIREQIEQIGSEATR